MIAYIITLFLLFLFLIVRTKTNYSFIDYLAFALLLILAMMRDYTVGTDLERYIQRFTFISDIRIQGKDSEWGYTTFISLLRNISNSAQFYIATTSICILTPIFFFLKKYSVNVVFSLLLFFILTGDSGYLFTYSGLRQSQALAIVIWGFHYIKNNKFGHASILLIIAYFIHNSVIFCIPILLLAKYYKASTRFLSILIVASSIIGFLGTIGTNFLDLLFQEAGIQSQLVNTYTTYAIDNQRNIYGLFMLIIPNTFIAIYALQKKMTDFYSNLFYYGVIFSNLLSTSPIVERYFLYFTILQIIIIPELYIRLKSQKERFILYSYILVKLLYFVYFYTKMLNNMPNLIENQVVPYKIFS